MDDSLPPSPTSDGGVPSSPAASSEGGIGSSGNDILPISDDFHAANGYDEATDTEAAGGHSLPAPDEIKADRPSSAGVDMRPIMVLLCLVLVCAISVGLGVGLTADNRREKNSSGSVINGNNPSANSKDRRQGMLDFIVEEGVSVAADFNFSGTPQSRALDFLAFIDVQQYQVPSGGMSTDQGYKFMQRYVMSVMYYSLGGPQWNYDLLFLSEYDTCDWFFVFQPPVGQVGVLCNQSTMKVIGVSFSK
jgi:hypothetical protein